MRLVGVVEVHDTRMRRASEQMGKHGVVLCLRSARRVEHCHTALTQLQHLGVLTPCGNMEHGRGAGERREVRHETQQRARLRLQ